MVIFEWAAAAGIFLLTVFTVIGSVAYYDLWRRVQRLEQKDEN